MRPIVVLLLAAAACAAESLDLAPGRHPEAIPVGASGLSVTAQEAASLDGLVTFAAPAEAGLAVSCITADPGETIDEDWRRTRTVALRLRQDLAAVPPEAVARRLSVQWDGLLVAPCDGMELAVETDGLCRLWLDLDGRGRPLQQDWVTNGWDRLGGTVSRHAMLRGVPAGTHRLRMQSMTGRGRTACALCWRAPGGDWRPVPAEAFTTPPVLRLDGPLRWNGQVAGRGTCVLGDGVALARDLGTARPVIAGAVALGADLSLASLGFDAGGRLALAGHGLRLDAVAGAGAVQLDGGALTLPPGVHGLRLIGPGTVAVAGVAAVADLGAEVRVAAGVLHAPGRFALRTRLAAPLATLAVCGDDAHGPLTLTAELEIEDDIPGGLGVGVWRADAEGRWFQRLHPGRLARGRHTLHIALDGEGSLRPEGHAGRWTADVAACADRIGLLLFADGPSDAGISCTGRLQAVADPPSGDAVLGDLVCDPPTAATGRRWSLSVRPAPYPANPFDAEAFALALVVTGPDGTVSRYAGFHDEPVTGIDRGDSESYRSTGPALFRVRFRPTRPGLHRLRLEGLWQDGRRAGADLPDLTATGPPWDGFARVDPADPRFLSAGGAFVWPVGCSLNSTYDRRCQHVMGTRLTPDRGSFTRTALLGRLIAGGGTGCEVWLSPWNLGLEWSDGWPGYRGAGRYHAGHAWALDRLLDQAEAAGVRVGLSLFNHGMARMSRAAESDWQFHPYNTTQGGWLGHSDGLFTDARARTMQERLFRYLTARYADSPAVLYWKLWAEVNLTRKPSAMLRDWHAWAGGRLAALDPWRHPVTTHWSNDWRQVDAGVAALPEIAFLCINAYHHADDDDPLTGQFTDAARGLSSFAKPIVTTEFGGSSRGTTGPRMVAEHAIGPWLGLVTGQAAAPMLWWFEWIDQGGHFGVYGALNRFLAGEDLRGQQASSIMLRATPRRLWCRAWRRPGQMLGYLLDTGWAGGGAESDQTGATIRVGGDVQAGAMVVEWWDPDAGVAIARRELTHPGGLLDLSAPPFRRHLAFKLRRAP